MDRRKWEPMAKAPKDGREIIAKRPRFEIYVRLAWDGRRWVSGDIPIEADFDGWIPMPAEPSVEGHRMGEILDASYAAPRPRRAEGPH